MIKFWEKYKFRILLSSGIAILYLVIIVVGQLVSGGRGEDFAFLVIYLNLPFYILFWLISGGGDLANFPIVEGFIIYLVSPLMYSLLVWLMGWAFEKCAFVLQEPNENFKRQLSKGKKDKEKA